MIDPVETANASTRTFFQIEQQITIQQAMQNDRSFMKNQPVSYRIPVPVSMVLYSVVLSVMMLMAVHTMPADAQPTRAAEESLLLENTRQLLFEGKRSGEGYWSSDGNKIIFQAERETDNPFYQIYTLDLTTGDVALVSTGTGKTTCAYFNWGKNNEEILFSSTHLDPTSLNKQQVEFELRETATTRRYSWDYDPMMHLFTANADGSNRVQITDAMGYDAEASYSPDGEFIAFSSTRSAYEQDLTPREQQWLENDPSYFGEIYIMRADGSDVTRLTTTPGYDGGPFFSPDGERIIWRRFDEAGYTADIFTMALDGSDVQRLTEFGAMSWAPYYHPSGEYVIFGSNKMGFANFELFLVDVAGEKEPQRVTYTEGFDSLPVFSPDGSKLLWTSNATSNRTSQLFLSNWNHEAALALLEQAPPRGEGVVLSTPEVRADELEQKVAFLASEKLEGRMTGSVGMEETKDYLIKELIENGLEPLENTYRFPFDYVEGIELTGKNQMVVTELSGDQVVNSAVEVPLYEGYMPLPFSSNGSVQGEVVFAGYGLKAPEELDLGYDDYANLDVEDKIVVVLDGLPDFLTEQQERTMLRYATQRYKAFHAKEQGAAAILFVDERARPYSGPRNERTAQEAGILSAEIKSGVIDGWLDGRVQEDGSALTVEAIRGLFESFNPHATTSFSFGLTGELAVSLETRMGTDENIVGMIYAQNAEKTILLGAHMDHLGYGETGSRATGEARNTIHYGADDNASGTAMILEMAEYLAHMERENPGTLNYNIAVAFWSGEELGLIGSSDFAQTDAGGLLPMEQVAAYLNFDMVGMLNNNQLILQGLGSSDAWRPVIEKKNVMAGFTLSLSDDPYVPTDAMALYQAGVPVLSVFTGLHDHYHMPTDVAENLNYEGMERIADFGLQILMEMNGDDAPVYKAVQMNETQQGAMRGFSVYLGTIPDYASQVKGVKLSGVREGGPAAKAGLRGGDIIIRMAGKEMNDLYDYTYALGDLKPDVEVDVTILRDGEELQLKITPEGR